MQYVDERTRFGELAGDWTDLSSGAVLVLAGLLVAGLVLLGFCAWLRGRRIGSILIFLVLMVSAVWFLAPPYLLEGWLTPDDSEVSLAVGAAVGAALFFGVLMAVRLAKPSSWWAQRLYTSEKYDRAVERHGWSRIRAR